MRKTTVLIYPMQIREIQIRMEWEMPVITAKTDTTPIRYLYLLK